MFLNIRGQGCNINIYERNDGCNQKKRNDE